MNTREWALVAFTILTQLSVGAFLVLAGVHYVALRTIGPEGAARLTHAPLLAAGGTLAAALVVSLLHLGHPAQAWLALANVRSSWLSREVALVLLFSIAGGLFALAVWTRAVPPAVAAVLSVAAAAAGLGAVFAMAAIYRLPAQVAWDTALTPFSFFTTTLLLGAAGAGAAIGLAQWTPAGAAGPAQSFAGSAMLMVAVAALVLVAGELVIAPMQMSRLAAAGTAQHLEHLRWLMPLRVALAASGAGFLALVVFRSHFGGAVEAAPAWLPIAVPMCLAFALLLAGQVVGRTLFYAAGIRAGI
jgi:anaerobic dimethyl sulfoxide reductase subunit C